MIGLGRDEPVVNADAVKGVAAGLAGVLLAFGKFHLSPEQLGALAVLWGAVTVLVGRFVVRPRVTPVAKAARQMAQAVREAKGGG
jgi:hypothetical protein